MEGECVEIRIGRSLTEHEIYTYRDEVVVEDAEAKSECAPSIRGFEALKEMKKKLKETNNRGLQARFGALNPYLEDDMTMIKGLHKINKCVGPFVGNFSLLRNQYYEGVWKADVSSAYPGEGMYNLPDLHGAKLVDEYVEPTEEWPIVFYLDSGHVAEYGKFDTHRDQYHVLYKQFRNRGENRVYKTQYKKEYKVSFMNGFRNETESCLCCKYSKYNLEEFKYFYDRKKQDEMAKAIMNLTIGTFDFVECPNYELKPWKGKYFGHLRALICARHNHNMIGYYDEIVKKGYRVLQIQTDSIMWQGGAIDSAIRDKEIGKLHLEIENGKAFIHGCGAYWIEDVNTAIEKHQGIRNWEGAQSLEEFKMFFENKKPIFEIWRLNPDTLKFELKEM